MDSKEDEKSPMYPITRLENGQDEILWEDEKIADEESVLMEVERALKHIVSHNNTVMYCPNCFALINTSSTSKEETVRCETPEVSKCFSFFSVFIPSDGEHTNLQSSKDKREYMDSKSKNSSIQNNEGEKSQTHSVTPLQNEGKEMLGEDGELTIEMDVERDLSYIDTHGTTTMYCDNCTTRITRVLIRKRSVIQPPTPESFRCFSFFSLFIPSGKGMAKREEDRKPPPGRTYGEDHIPSLRIPTGRPPVRKAGRRHNSEEHAKPHKDVIVRTLKGKIKPK